MMAATYGPDGVLDTLKPMTYDSTSPLQMTELSQQTTPSLPPFVFPSRPAAPSPLKAQFTPSTFSTSTSAPALPPSSRPGGRRRPRSAIEPHSRQLSLADDGDASSTKSPALPACSFNPGADVSHDASVLSPPLSPASPRTIPSRPGGQGNGHRRGGSEFVGGTIRGGDTIAVIGTSPTKSESGFASPGFPPPRPAGRRGHAHRRSAALSSHDLSSIMHPTSPNPSVHGSSVPSSPAVFDRQTPSETRQTAPIEHPPTTMTEKSPASAKGPESENPPPKPASRTRVGFSDAIEYIPRPLSLVSSDTSSTITARPGHSVSGSISSVVSAATITPVEAEADTAAHLTPSHSRGVSESRPSTAGAILERTQSIDLVEPASGSPRRRNSIPLLISVDNPSSNDESSQSPTKTPKRWSFFGLEPFVGTSSPRGSRPASSSSCESVSNNESSANSSKENVSEAGDQESSAAKSCSKKAKKQKKVKAWAGSILTRRSKNRQAKSDQTVEAESPKEDIIIPAPDEELVQGVEVYLPAPAMPVVMVTGTPGPNDSEPPKPRPVSEAEEDSAYPVIDLDAALGPFNTPLPFNPEWEAAQRAGAAPKRKLHSAAGMSNFSGPGGHYHRRAESAPEMVPFEPQRFGIPRFGSSSTMADVFEEEEEEDETKPKEAKPRSEQQVTVVDIPITEEPVAEQAAVSEKDASSKMMEAGDSSDCDKHSTRTETPAASVHEEVSRPIAPDAAIFEVPRDHCDSAQASPRRVVALQNLTPVDVSLQLPGAALAPGSPFSMSHSSSFPSPRSPMSFDANRVSTAPSSIAEENTFQSLLMGEPGPEVRYSVDDIPSLTSSNSTMTKDSSFTPQPRSSHGNLSGQRPVSFSSAPFSRRRSSLASLSRLISSSHGERSKLSIEVTCDEPEKKPKSKAKRLSKLVQFWKPNSKEPPMSA